MEVNMHINYVKKSIDDGKTAADMIRDEVWDVLKEQMDLVMQESSEIVPVLTGALKSTLHMELNESNMTIDVSYGVHKDTFNIASNDYVSNYALEVHDDMSRPPRSGERKYLENPFNKHTENLEGVIKAKLGGMFD